MDDIDQYLKQSLVRFITYMLMFPVINIFNALVKLFVFGVNYGRINSSLVNEISTIKKIEYFWKSFVIDNITYSFPIVLYITVLTFHVEASYVILYSLSFILYKIIVYKWKKIEIVSDINEASNNENFDPNVLEAKIIKISINGFRSSVFIITSVAILAVDFALFPRVNAKTNKYGISLMDVGVGYFILCHAQRVIRNSNNNTENSFKTDLKRFPKYFYDTCKKSSLLLAIGFLRLFLIYATNYRGHGLHYGEYGLHWNFFFTIFFVKVVATPFELIVRRKSLRALILSFVVGCFYQYLLSYHNYTDYVLDIDGVRNTIIDQNKEGVYSLFGYLSIYFAGEAICFRVNYLMRERLNPQEFDKFKISIKCAINIIIFCGFYWILTELTRYYIQNVSRKMCNLPFVFLMVMSGNLLWAFMLIGDILITKLIIKLKNKTSNQHENNSKILNDAIEIISVLETSFSFVERVDSKFIGLLVFLIANLSTGFVNLSTKPGTLDDIVALIILFIHITLSLLIPLGIFYVYYVKRYNNSNTRKSNSLA